jgi:hypothetical protein
MGPNLAAGVHFINGNGGEMFKLQSELTAMNAASRKDPVLAEETQKSPEENDDEFHMEGLMMNLQSVVAMDQRELWAFQELIDLRIADIEERIFRHIQEKNLASIDR